MSLLCKWNHEGIYYSPYLIPGTLNKLCNSQCQEQLKHNVGIKQFPSHTVNYIFQNLLIYLVILWALYALLMPRRAGMLYRAPNTTGSTQGSLPTGHGKALGQKMTASSHCFCCDIRNSFLLCAGLWEPDSRVLFTLVNGFLIYL